MDNEATSIKKGEVRTMLTKINQITSIRFSDEKELLDFYRKELPARVSTFRLDEVGPIMSTGSKEELEGYLVNRFYFNGIGMDMGSDIDWYGTPNGDLEWNGGFVRQGHFMYLADAYEETGDETYAAAIVTQMLDYIRKMPPYDPEGKPYLEYKKSTWRPFEAAGRAAENWPVALAKIISSASMTPAAFAEIFYSIYQHAVFLSKHHWRTGNHACLEVAGLGVLSVFYRELKEADHWRTYAVDFLMEMLDEQFHDDGYTQEMSGAYHWVAMRNFFAFYQVALHSGMESIFPARYVDVLRKAAFAELYQQKPDFSLPVTNDSNVTTQHRAQLEQLSCLIDKNVLDYRLSGTAAGIAPAHTSYFFDDARVGIMRSDWTRNAVYGCFDMGRWGTNHMNEDQLNFELSAYGRNLLVNCGRWRYTTSPGVEWVGKAQYFKTTAAYNSLLCDDLCQMPADATGVMTVRDKYDYAKGMFEGGYGREVDVQDEALLKEKGVTSGKIQVVDHTVHTREILFAKPDFFVLRDTITFDGAHTATQVWHMACGEAVSHSEHCVYSRFDDANFIMVQLGSTKQQIVQGSEAPFKGWNCPKYDFMEPAPEINFTKEGIGSIVFETLIYPIQGAVDTGHFPVFEKTDGANGTTYTVTYGGKTTRIAAGDTWTVLE